MARNHFHKRYVTLEQAVDEVVNSTGSDEDDIIILSPEQGDSYATDIEEEEEDICHKNDKLPNDVVGFLEVHKKNSDENEVDSDISETVQIEETSSIYQIKKKKESVAVKWGKKQCLKEIPEANITDLANSHPHLVVLEPVSLFRLLFNNEICSLIAIETE